MMDVKRGQRSVRAWTIFHDDRLPKRRTKLVGDDAGDRIAAAAWTERIDKGDRPRRKIIGVKRAAEQCGQSGDDNKSELFHAPFLPAANCGYRNHGTWRKFFNDFSRARMHARRKGRGLACGGIDWLISPDGQKTR